MYVYVRERRGEKTTTFGADIESRHLQDGSVLINEAVTANARSGRVGTNDQVITTQHEEKMQLNSTA